jgi:L-prolyl-PCP dehydrogenase
MDFALSEEQRRLKESVVTFAQGLNAGLMARDQAGELSRDLWIRCARFGIQGLAVPAEFGGQGLDALTTVLALEGLGYGCRDNGLIFALNAQMWGVQAPILRFGSGTQRQAYLPKLVSGEWIGAHGMSEPGSGSDAFSLATTAVPQGDGYVLNGRKTFVSNAVDAQLFLVFATVDRSRGFMGLTAFLVPRDTPGLSVDAPTSKMGLKTAPMADVVLEDCRVPREQRLAEEGNGATIFKHSMGWERSCILASCLGTMQRQLEACVRYATTRQQFGKSIASFQAVSHRIVDMKVSLDAARLMVQHAAWLRDRGEPADAESAMAKLYVSESFVQSSLAAIQLHGGYGYCTEFEVERDLRDALATRIYSGTSEMQKEIIARSLGLYSDGACGAIR